MIRLRAGAHRLAARARRRPVDILLGAGAVALVAWILLAPFFVAKYPPLIDFPFHAAHTSAFRHYFDPAFHFREQFSLHPLEVPYVSSYALGALLMWVAGRLYRRESLLG